MTRKQYGLAPSGSTDEATKGYVDNAIISERSASAVLSNKAITAARVDYFTDTNGAPILLLSPITGAVNYLQFFGGGTNVGPTVNANGTDTNIDLLLTSKGTGLIKANGVAIADVSSTQTLSGKTLTNPVLTNYTESVVAIGTVSSSSTISLASGTVQTATLTASTACTFTMPTATAGKSFTLYLKQPSSTGGGSATFTGVKWSGGTAPTITTTAGVLDIISFVSDGTNWYGSFVQNFTY